MTSNRKAKGWSVFPRLDPTTGVANWVLSFQVAPGEWKQHRLGPCKNKLEAERRARTWLAEQRSGGTLPSPEHALEHLLPKWLMLREGNPKVARSTVRDSASIVKNHLLESLGKLLIGEIAVPRLRDFVRGLIAADLAPNTIRNVMNTLSTFYLDAMDEGWVKRGENIIRARGVLELLPDVETLSGGEVVWVPLPVVQPLVLSPAVPAARRLRYVMAFTSGLRDGELAGLTWADVDLDAEVPVYNVGKAFALRAGEGYAAIAKTKTRGSNRLVPVHPAALAALGWWKEDGWEFYVGRPPLPTDPVLASPNGTHWRPKSARRLREDLETAGCPTADAKGNEYTFHAARRSFATYLYEAGVDQETRDRLMGHARKGTAARHYTGAILAKLLASVETIALRYEPCAEDCADAQDLLAEAAILTGGAPANETAAKAVTAASASQNHEEDGALDDDDAPGSIARLSEEAGRLSSVVEQRFRKPDAPKDAAGGEGASRGETSVVGTDDDGATGDEPPPLRPIAQWLHNEQPRRARSVSAKRAAEDRVAALLIEATELAKIAGSLPVSDAIEEAVASRLIEASRLLASVREEGGAS